jgi:uncharacterized repeat protein (TIGR03803 family)
MNPRSSFLACDRISSFAIAVLVFAASTFASTEKVVYSFPDLAGGAGPEAGLVADSAGNLYGTASAGGANSSCNCGTVFELSPPTTSGGAWTETVLYSFQGGTSDGMRPGGTLIFDTQGNLYGTTIEGGNNNQGTVFELSPPAVADGAWTETLLWAFPASGERGAWPAGLAMDAEGDLFGTGYLGGANRAGVVWELLKPRAGFNTVWVEKVLYSFGAVANDGANPGPNIVFRDGVIYGTAIGGSGGAVFQLVNHSGDWTEQILYHFTGVEGAYPGGGVIRDAAGNLYGTLYQSGPNPCSCGAIYELSPPAVAGDPWLETTLYTFTYHGDGGYPLGKLWRDNLGDLFGTATGGGIRTGNGDQTYGTVFKLKAPAVSGGSWILQPLHDFGGIPANDGSLPSAQLILVNGILYGTTSSGGSNFIAGGGGTVFSVVP